MDTANKQLGERGESGTSQWIKEVRQLNYNTHGLNTTPQLVETDGREKKREERRKEGEKERERERERERKGEREREEGREREGGHEEYKKK